MDRFVNRPTIPFPDVAQLQQISGDVIATLGGLLGGTADAIIVDLISPVLEGPLVEAIRFLKGSLCIDFP